MLTYWGIEKDKGDIAVVQAFFLFLVSPEVSDGLVHVREFLSLSANLLWKHLRGQDPKGVPH